MGSRLDRAVGANAAVGDQDFLEHGFTARMREGRDEDPGFCRA